jgi:phosphate transport system permease protein
MSSIKASKPPNYRFRTFTDYLMHFVLICLTLVAAVPLVWITGYVLVRGGSALSVEFLTSEYEPPDFASETGSIFAGMGEQEGEGAGPAIITRGGILHGIVGTLIITSLALVLVIPIGVLSGVYLAEYGNNRLATIVHFACDVLSGAPSIVVGVTAYILIVRKTGQFSALAGSLALSFLMVPTVTRATEETLKLIPSDIREAAMALGAPKWATIFRVVIPAALPGIATAVLLAFARGAGETAPLIFTVLGSATLGYELIGPMAALPLIIYRYTDSPYPSEQVYAWGAAFVLTVLILLINILVRVATNRTVHVR